MISDKYKGVNHNFLSCCPFLQSIIFINLLQWKKTIIFQVWNLVVLTPEMEFSAKISLVKVIFKNRFDVCLCPKSNDKATDFQGLWPSKTFKTSHFVENKRTSLPQFLLKFSFLESKLMISNPLMHRPRAQSSFSFYSAGQEERKIIWRKKVAAWLGRRGNKKGMKEEKKSALLGWLFWRKREERRRDLTTNFRGNH